LALALALVLPLVLALALALALALVMMMMVVVVVVVVVLVLLLLLLLLPPLLSLSLSLSLSPPPHVNKDGLHRDPLPCVRDCPGLGRRGGCPGLLDARTGKHRRVDAPRACTRPRRYLPLARAASFGIPLVRTPRLAVTSETGERGLARTLSVCLSVGVCLFVARSLAPTGAHKRKHARIRTGSYCSGTPCLRVLARAPLCLYVRAARGGDKGGRERERERRKQH
jgi:hypothetical protein